MITYRCEFNGRLIGSIGVTYDIVEYVDVEEVDSKVELSEAAMRWKVMTKLYEKFDHITRAEITKGKTL